MSGTVIRACTCENEFQDKKYGYQQRVCNKKASPSKVAVCTVCGKER